MGLWKQQSTHTHARIYSKGDDTVQTWNINQNSELTTPTHWNQIWSQKAICHRRRRIPPPLHKDKTKYIQAVTGTLLYYAQAVEPTILTALSSLATEQAKPMQQTKQKVKQLLDYCATQEDAIITYSQSKMILNIHSDAEYCNKKKAQSWAGGHFLLSNRDNPPPPTMEQ